MHVRTVRSEPKNTCDSHIKCLSDLLAGSWVDAIEVIATADKVAVKLCAQLELPINLPVDATTPTHTTARHPDFVA